MDAPTPDEAPSDAALRRLLADRRVRAAAAGPAQTELWAALCRATEGGKRFRPALVTAAHEALGGRQTEAAATIGAAVELLHTAFVVHDDVIDGDDVRRGRLNVSGTFEAEALASGAVADRARHFGRTAGILAGDLALTAAIRAVATCGAPAATVGKLLDLFDEVLHATAAGELADVRLALDGIDGAPAPLAEVLRMEEQKTSVYSFQLPLQAGAILAGADASLVERLGIAGRMLGLAFQLADDLLGLYGDPAETGKSTVSDLREGKQTSLVAHARGTELADEVTSLLGRDLTVSEADRARALLEQSGSRSFVERLALDYARTAEQALEELGMPASFRSSLSALTALVAATPRSAA